MPGRSFGGHRRRHELREALKRQKKERKLHERKLSPEEKARIRMERRKQQQKNNRLGK